MLSERIAASSICFTTQFITYLPVPRRVIGTSVLVNSIELMGNGNSLQVPDMCLAGGSPYITLQYILLAVLRSRIAAADTDWMSPLLQMKWKKGFRRKMICINTKQIHALNILFPPRPFLR